MSRKHITYSGEYPMIIPVDGKWRFVRLIEATTTHNREMSNIDILFEVFLLTRDDRVKWKSVYTDDIPESYCMSDFLYGSVGAINVGDLFNGNVPFHIVEDIITTGYYEYCNRVFKIDNITPTRFTVTDGHRMQYIDDSYELNRIMDSSKSSTEGRYLLCTI
jgi:hypothetical protein